MDRVGPSDSSGLDEPAPLPAADWRGTDTVRQIVGKSHYGPVAEFDATTISRSRAVAYIRRSDGIGGTGFLIAPDVLITNNHVLPSVDHADSCTVWFNFNSGEPGNPEAGGAEPYQCRSVGAGGMFWTSPAQETGVDSAHLDYTVVRVAGSPGDRWGYVPLTATPYAPLNAGLTVIQHPAQRPTYVGQGVGQLKYRSELVLQYVTDTEPGSSGAPCFNSFWELVGIHHRSVKLPPQAVAEDGSRRGNQGIAIAAILEDLAINLPELVLPAEHRDDSENLIWPRPA